MRYIIKSYEGLLERRVVTSSGCVAHGEDSAVASAQFDTSLRKAQLLFLFDLAG